MTAAACPSLAVRQIRAAIEAHSYRCARETQLQEAVAEALRRAGYAVQREVYLTPADRVDLLVGDVGIEVKIASPADAVFRQLARYATSDLVAELMLVTTRYGHRALPSTVDGKPLTVVFLGGAV